MKKFKDKIYYLLNKYSKKVGLDLPYFVKGGFWLSLNQFFSLLKAFMLSLIFANILSKQTFGEYSFILSILGIAGSLVLPGMGVAVVQAVARGYDGTYFKALKEIIKWSWLGSLFLIGFSIYEYFFGNYSLGLVFLLLSIVFPLYPVSGFYPNFLNGKKRFDILAKLSIIFNIITTILISITAFISKSAFWIAILSVLLQIIIGGYYSLFYVKKYLENNYVDEESIKFGKKISPSITFSSFVNNFDSLIIVYFLGYEELAIYKIVTLIPNQIKIAINALSPMILPKMASQDLKKKDVIIHMKKLFFIILFLIGIYWLIAPIIFKIFYPKYYKYVWLSMIFHLSFIAFLNLIPYTYLLKEKKNTLVSKFYNWSSFLSIFVSIVLIHLFGLIGAIVSRIIYRFLTMFILFFYFYSYNKK